ncbi:MAG: acetylornithine transaminase [Burkholderiaceae bacterium]|nr:acetylornithine transaminase [Burkholderiaceae bacterium]
MKIDRFDTDALMHIAPRPATVFVEGRGSWLTDHRGRRYLDFVQGWAVNALGHCPPQIAQALASQAARLINPGPAYFNDAAIALAQRLAQLSGLPKVFLASSGAEANEGAIKLARRWGRRHRGGAFEIITFADAFHGRTLATMSASGKAGWERLFEPKVAGFPKARINDLGSVEAQVGPATVAVMLEPVQGEAGVIPATPQFLRELRALCDRHDLLLILDEVQTGIGRTGTLFAFEQAGIAPDVLTLGKGLGGGTPLSALLAGARADCFEPGDQGGTYCGNPLMAAVGCAALDTVAQPAFLAAVRARAAQLQSVLAGHAARIGGAVRAAGLLQALVLPAAVAAQVVEQARDAAEADQGGLLLNAARPDVLRLMPALNVSADEIDQLDRLLGAALARAGL